MLGSAPAIRGEGELEATAAWSLTNRLDVGATYSPARHVPVRAASTKGALSAGASTRRYAQANQYEVAAGTYWPLGRRGLVAQRPVGARVRYVNDDKNGLTLPTSFVQHQFDASYRKYSGEAYGSWPPPCLSMGGGVPGGAIS